MNKKQVILLAAFLYLFILPFTYHPDIKTIFYQTQFLSKGVFNIYSFFSQNNNLAFLGPFVYPPLAYFLYGILFIPVKVFAGSGFINWLSMGNDAVTVKYIFQYLFVIKLPSVFAVILSGYVISLFFKEEKKKVLALTLWFFNPITIYTAVFMGQIDSFVVLFTILALYYSKKRGFLSSLFLGLAAAIKTYPLILIPFLAFNISKNWKKSIKYLLYGSFVFFLSISLFLKSSAFYNSALVSGLSTRIFELKLPIGFGESIYLIPLILIGLFLSNLRQNYTDIGNLNKIFFLVTFIIVAGSHFHPQWALWFTPFLIIYLVLNDSLRNKDTLTALVLFFVGFSGTVFLFDDKFLSWGLLSPLDPGVLFLPTPAQVIKGYIDPGMIQSIFHSLFFISGIWLVLPGQVIDKIIKKHDKKK